MQGPGAGAGRIDHLATLGCVHCGLCLPSCPTYQETGRETSSPRGRVYLMRGIAEGRVALDERVREEMYLCLACRACESACPAGVRYGHLLDGMRAEIEARLTRPAPALAARRLALRLVASRRLLRVAAAGLRFYQRGGLQRLLRRTRLLRLLPPLARADRALPRLSGRVRLPSRVLARGEPRGRVAFFAGCVMGELLGAANQATLEVLAANGFEVTIPRGQRCCGALHLHAGDPEGAGLLRRANQRAFGAGGVDAILVSSAGCGLALKEYGEGISSRVRDLSEFLHDTGLRPPPGPLAMRVAYDDPCHLLHGQRVAEAPRALLEAIPGLELVDLPGARDCCGAAGIYALTHPAMSDRLAARKLAAIREVSPDAVATGNPGCLLRIASVVEAAGLPVEVVHPVELLARAYAAVPPGGVLSGEGRIH